MPKKKKGAMKSDSRQMEVKRLEMLSLSLLHIWLKPMVHKQQVPNFPLNVKWTLVERAWNRWMNLYIRKYSHHACLYHDIKAAKAFIAQTQQPVKLISVVRKNLQLSGITQVTCTNFYFSSDVQRPVVILEAHFHQLLLPK